MTNVMFCRTVFYFIRMNPRLHYSTKKLEYLRIMFFAGDFSNSIVLHCFKIHGNIWK